MLTHRPVPVLIGTPAKYTAVVAAAIAWPLGFYICAAFSVAVAAVTARHIVDSKINETLPSPYWRGGKRLIYSGANYIQRKRRLDRAHFAGVPNPGVVAMVEAA
jgi:hypothetical protein